MSQCPSCGASLPEGAVLCVQCGFHLQEGKRLTTESATPEIAPAAEPPAAAAAGNPYQSPAAAPTGLFAGKTRDGGRLRHNYDVPTRVTYLEERVRELERRVDSTWLLSPNFLMRMLAVWGFAMLANLMIWLIIFFLTLVARALAA